MEGHLSRVVLFRGCGCCKPERPRFTIAAGLTLAESPNENANGLLRQYFPRNKTCTADADDHIRRDAVSRYDSHVPHGAPYNRVRTPAIASPGDR